MRQFSIVLHEPIGQVLHIGYVRVGAKRAFGLLLDDGYAKAKSLLHQKKVPVDDMSHFYLLRTPDIMHLLGLSHHCLRRSAASPLARPRRSGRIIDGGQTHVRSHGNAENV
jgi:hypothetical protein